MGFKFNPFTGNFDNAGVSDASELTYTPAVLADWNGSADPGNQDDANDQLASRVKLLEALSGAAAGGITFVRKTADESVTSSTALQDDDELKFNIASNEIWEATFKLAIDAATGGDIKFAVNVPSGATGRLNIWGPDSGASASPSSIVLFSTTTLTDAGVITVGGFGAGTAIPVRCELIIANGATAGLVKLRWAQGTSSGTASKVLANSTLNALRIYPTKVAFNPRTSWDWFTDCEDEFGASTAQEWQVDAVGAGTAVGLSGVAGVPGVWTLSTGTTATGFARVIRGLPGTATLIVTLDATQVTEFQSRVRVPTLPDGTQTFSAAVGWRDAFLTTALVQFAAVYDSGSGNVYWQGLARTAAGVSTTTTFTSGPVVVANTWYRLKIVATTGLLTFYVDDVAVGTITTNIPTTGMTMYGAISKTVGTTNRTFQVDYFWTHIDFITPR